MIAWRLAIATTSDRSPTVSSTILVPWGCIGRPMIVVPSTADRSSMSASSARSAMLAPACTTTTASTPRKRLTIDSRVRILRARMPCRPMISADRNRPDSRLTRAPAG
jgi:hypothetical protein